MRGRVIKRGDQGVVFGDVIGVPSDIFSKRLGRRSVRTPNHDAVGSRAGISPRRSINICRVGAFDARRRRFGFGKQSS